MKKLVTFGMRSPRATSSRRLMLHTLVLVTLFSSVSALFAPIAAAAGESYKWINSSTIQVTGGDLDASYNMTVGTDQATKKIIANGSTELQQDGDDFCKPNILAELNADRKSGKITSVAIIPSTSPPGQPAANCSSDNQSIMDAWVGSSIAISGSAGPETEEQKKVDIAYYTLLKKSESPAKVTFTTEGPGGLYAEFQSNKGSDGNYYGTFFGITAGEWKFCVKKSGKIPETCEIFTKNAYQKGLVVLGESRDKTANRIEVKVEVNPRVADPYEDETFGPFAIELRDKDGKVVQTKDITVKYISSCNIESTDSCGGGEVIISSSFVYNKVTPGDYKVCYGTVCVDAKKVDNKVLSVTLKFGQSDIDATGTGTDEGAGGGTSCAIDNIGWIICPVINFMAKIVDATYGWVSGLLTVQPISTTTEGGKNMYSAWSIMRNFANISFVIAFLIIIYSQITGGGLSNYGLKKMLPKLVIAAILVNVSYWICAIAVDISNILGTSLKDLFDSMGQTLRQPEFGASSTGAGGSGWAGIAVVVLAGTATVAILGVSVLLPALIAAVVAIVTVFLVLTLRQALIILLIVISPLAFVAYLLPNTEDLFKKWLSLFKTLLLMFPIIAIIFGASAMASRIVTTSATDVNGDGDFAVQIMGALITILPLALTPIVMKTAGGVLNRFGGFVNNPNKGPFDRMRKGAGTVRENTKVSRGLRAMDPNKRSFPGRRSFINYANKRSAINSGKSEQFTELQKEDMAKLAVSDSGFAQKVAGNRSELYQHKQETYLASIDPGKLKLDLDKSKISNMVAQLTLSVKDPANMVSEMKKVLQDEAKTGGDAIKARAAQEMLMGAGNKGTGALREALSTVDRNSEAGIDLRKDIASSNLKGKAADVYQWSVDGQGRSLGAVSKAADTWSGLSDAQLSGQVEGAMGAAVASGGVSQAKAQSTLASRGSENIGEREAKILSDHAKRAGPGS